MKSYVLRSQFSACRFLACLLAVVGCRSEKRQGINLMVAFPRRAGAAKPSPVVFSLISKEELSLVYGDEMAILDTPYQDGEYSNLGSVREP